MRSLLAPARPLISPVARPRRRWRAIRPVGGQRGTELEITLSGAGWAMPRRSSTTSRASRRSRSRRSTTTTSRPRSRSPPDCALGSARPAGPDGDRDQRAAHVQRRGAQGDRRGRAQQRLRGPAGDPDERDGQRRRRQRGRRLLRRRGQEGRADLGRGRGPPAGDQRVRPVRGDPGRQAVRAGVSDDAALVWRDGFTSIIAPEDGKYIIQVRESAYAGNGGCLYRLHVGNFPRATAVMPAGGKPGETVAGALDRRRGRRDHDDRQAPGRRSSASSASSARTTRGSLPIPTRSGSRRSAT